MKPKLNYKPGAMDNCQTPPHALAPLLGLFAGQTIIWEPAAGEGNIVHTLTEYGYRVVESDILNGQDFFTCEPDNWDVQVTNPPYGLKYQWLDRSYELGKPFALLIPVETLGAAKCNRLMAEYENDNWQTEIILFTKRINFKMPNKGYEGTAQFPVMWYTYGLSIGKQLSVWDVDNEKFL